MTWEDYKARGIPGRLDAAHAGLNPTVIAQMPSGWAVMCDSQVQLGWCILVADPTVSNLNDLDLAAQQNFLRDMALLGRALEDSVDCARMNYAIYGNADPFLHAHLIPRYASEPEEQRRQPIWRFVRLAWSEPERQFDPAKHGELQGKIRTRLLEAMKEAGIK